MWECCGGARGERWRGVDDGIGTNRRGCLMWCLNVCGDVCE